MGACVGFSLQLLFTPVNSNMSVMKREFLLIFVEKSEIKECHPYNDKYRHWEIVITVAQLDLQIFDTWWGYSYLEASISIDIVVKDGNYLYQELKIQISVYLQDVRVW